MNTRKNYSFGSQRHSVWRPKLKTEDKKEQCLVHKENVFNEIVCAEETNEEERPMEPTHKDKSVSAGINFKNSL